MEGSRTYWCGASTDPWELFATEEVENSLASNEAFQNNLRLGSAAFYFPDEASSLADRDGSEGFQSRFCLIGWDKGNESSLVGHIQGIQPQDFAGPLYSFVDGDGGFTDTDLDLGLVGDFV